MLQWGMGPDKRYPIIDFTAVVPLPLMMWFSMILQ